MNAIDIEYKMIFFLAIIFVCVIMVVIFLSSVHLDLTSPVFFSLIINTSLIVDDILLLLSFFGIDRILILNRHSLQP